jgi:hypothetical protein
MTQDGGQLVLTLLQILELDDSRNEGRRAVARDLGPEGCTGDECEGEFVVGDICGEVGDVEERFVEIGMGPWAGLLVLVVVARVHDEYGGVDATGALGTGTSTSARRDSHKKVPSMPT